MLENVEVLKMKINNKMQERLNKQINAELYASYLYLSMSANFESKNMPGLAHWMKMQAREEVGHAMRIYDYVFERGGEVALMAIEKPAANWTNPLSAFQAAYEHEKKVTGMIDGLVDLARKEADKATESFLKWFVDEQVEEEKQTDEIVQKLKMIRKSANGLFMLDHELAKRKSE
jgi:ferritin